jgi:hypothetical protein
MSKNSYCLFALLMMGLLSPPTLCANAPSDSGSKEALKETAIRYTDTFTNKEFMVFESVGNEGYEKEKQFSKMTFYVAPLFRLIPNPDTQAVYQKTPYSHRGIVQYTFFVECFPPRIEEQALKKVNKYYSKTKGEYVFTEEQVHHMRHGKVVIKAANLPAWIKIEPVVIGTDTPNSTVMLDAVEEFTVEVPLDMDKDFQTRLDSGMKFKFVVYFNVMNLSRLTLSWSVEDIRKTSAYKQINSGGAHYVTAEQVHNMTRQVAEKKGVYYYQDPGIDDKIADKALSLFDKVRGDMQELSVQNRQQATELEAKLREGTGLSPSEFKPLTLMWDVYEKLETVDDHKTANKVIQEAYQQSQQAYQQLDKAYQNSLGVKTGFDYDLGLTEGKGNAYYEHDYQSTESSKQRSSKEDKINKGYFENADALTAYQAKTTEQKRPEVKIVGRGLKVIEKSQFEQNINSMASFVFVQPMTQAKSFTTDDNISTHSKNDLPSMLEKLKKAALLTDAVSVSEDGYLTTNNNLILALFSTPQIKEFSFTGLQDFEVTLPKIGNSIKAILADIFVTVNKDDHINIVLGKDGGKHRSWVFQKGTKPSSLFGKLARQSVILTHHGEADKFTANYGVWYSSQIIPLKSNGTIQFANFSNSGSNGWVYMIIRGYYK